MFKKVIFFGLIVILVVSVVLSGCSSSKEPESTAPIRMGALYMLPILPLYVAQQEGLFQEEGIKVEIVPFRSQLDRDTAIHAGQLDCAMEDIYSAPILNKEGDLIRVLAASQVQSYMFAIIASQQSNIKTVADLKNTEIASSLGNIIEYVTDKMCEAGGLKSEEIKKNSIASMPLRLEMLNQGKIEAATFSRMLSDMAILGGGRLICDDSQNSLMTVCLYFTTSFLKDRPEDTKKFLKAWDKAVQKISNNPSAYLNTLISAANISADLAGKIEVPKFDQLRMPTRDEYNSKMEWNLARGNISHRVEYEEIVDSGYLP